MPTYQYACTQCDERLEAVQSFSDAPLTECPVCGGRLRKVFSAVGVVFKGSGFYKTDSRSTSAGKGSGDGAGSKETAAKDTGSSGGKDAAAAPAVAKSGGESSSSSNGKAAAAPAAKSA